MTFANLRVFPGEDALFTTALEGGSELCRTRKELSKEDANCVVYVNKICKVLSDSVLYCF